MEEIIHYDYRWYIRSFHIHPKHLQIHICASEKCMGSGKFIKREESQAICAICRSFYFPDIRK